MTFNIQRVPTMFLIFVNDLVNLCLNSSTLLFADDTVIYLHGKNTNELLTKVQEDLNQIEKWCTFNKLSLNVKKTKAMFFGNSFRRDANPQFTLTLNGGLIDFVDNYEYLGVKLDPCLHFDKHMSKVKRNVGEKLHMLSLICSSITTKCAVCIYKCKILPFIEYGNIVLNACTATELPKLQRMQNRCLRVALRRDQLSNVTDLHREASLLPLKYRINTSLLKILFDHSREPDNLDVKVRGSSTRLHDGPIFPVPFPKSEGFKKSVAYYGPTLWNALPHHIRMASDKKYFTRLLKTKYWETLNAGN